MKAAYQRRQGLGALELIEEAVHLLRLAPGRALTAYFLGGIPFVLGLLYFVTDMSRSAFAPQHCAEAAFGLTLLFIWMKTWQTVFARELLVHLGGEAGFAWTPGELARIAMWQAIVQSSGLFLLSFASMIVLPFGWAYAFYQNATVLGAGRLDGVRDLVRRSLTQTFLWPRQNHVALIILGLFGLVVFVDLFVAVMQVPQLLKAFLGIESVYTRSSGALYNTTTFAAVCGLAYLCVDPLFKALYVLRCFYGQSLESGADLRADLRRVRSGAAALALMLVLCAGMNRASGQEPPSPPPSAQPAVSPVQLDRSIEKVLSERRYTWRMPREKSTEIEKEKGAITSFLDAALDTVAGWFKSVGGFFKRVWHAIGDFLDWIAEKLGGKKSSGRSGGGSGSGWMVTMQAMIFVLLAVTASALAIFFWRLWRGRQRRPDVVVAQAVAATPDLNDENVAADQLEEDGWMKLARELAEQGNTRLALRALYLASLAHLARREMLHIARFKSNWEYERELRRRARALPELQQAFAANVTIFDRVWYGMHEVTAEAFDDFQTNLERMRTC